MTTIKQQIKTIVGALAADNKGTNVSVYTETASRLCFKAHKTHNPDSKAGWRFVAHGQNAPSVDDKSSRIQFTPASGGPRFITNAKLTHGKFETDKKAQYAASFHPDDTDTIGYQLTNTIRQAHKEGMCGKGTKCNVMEDYLMRSATWVDALVVLRDGEANTLGFVTLIVKPKKVLYIDVICSSGGGSGQFLMDTMMKLAGRIGHSLQLSSLSNLFAYYNRLGFEIRDSCDKAPNKDLMRQLLAVGEAHGDRTTSKGVKFFSAANIANNNPQMAKLLQAHAAAGHNSNCGVETYRKQLATAKLVLAGDQSSTDWFQMPCSEDGTPLLYCPESRPVEPTIEPIGEVNKTRKRGDSVTDGARPTRRLLVDHHKPSTPPSGKASRKRKRSRQLPKYTAPVTRSQTRKRRRGPAS